MGGGIAKLIELTRGQLVVFFGYTGVGKSTCIKRVGNTIKKRGVKAKTIRIKNYYPFSSLLLRLYGMKKGINQRRWISIASQNLGKTGIKLEILKLSIMLDLPVNIFHLIVTSILKIRLFLYLKRIVLIEDYIFERLVDLLYANQNYGVNLRIVNTSSNLLLRLKPNNTTEVVLVANNLNLKNRWNRRKSDSEHPEYLKIQHRMIEYCKQNANDLIFVETDDKSIIDVLEEILSKLYA